MGKYFGETKSGSVNGITFSHNRYGQYFRKHAIPVNPNTEAQRATRTAFSQASAVWSSLSDLERSGWNYVAQRYPVTDKMGVQKTLDGHTFFTRFNIKRILAGAEILRDIELDDITPPWTESKFAKYVQFHSPDFEMGLQIDQHLEAICFALALNFYPWSLEYYEEYHSFGYLSFRISRPCKYSGVFVAQNEMRELYRIDPTRFVDVGLPTWKIHLNGLLGSDVYSLHDNSVLVLTKEDDPVFSVDRALAKISVKAFPQTAYYRIQVVRVAPNLINEEVISDFWQFIDI